MIRSVLRLWPASLVLIAAASCSSLGIHGADELLVESFDDDGKSLSTRLLEHEAIAIAEAGGINGSEGIRVIYEGYPQGSRRVVAHYPLPRGALEATLTYDVRFCDDFQFVKAGKLHGLGPMNPVAGNLPVGADQWSARVVFRRNGKIGTYLYHQDQPKRHGEYTMADDFRFERGRYYSVSLYVRLNDPPQASNGRAVLFVDGTKVASHEGVRYRAVGGEATLIHKLMFSTFHGGHTPDFAPRRRDGSFSRECAYFDNFAVYPGLHVEAHGA